MTSSASNSSKKKWKPKKACLFVGVEGSWFGEGCFGLQAVGDSQHCQVEEDSPETGVPAAAATTTSTTTTTTTM